MVGVLERQRRQGVGQASGPAVFRATSFEGGAVERRQLADEDGDRPAVGRDVMEGREEDVLLAGEAEERRAERRPGRQVERAKRLGGGEPRHLAGAAGRGERR